MSVPGKCRSDHYHHLFLLMMCLHRVQEIDDRVRDAGRIPSPCESVLILNIHDCIPEYEHCGLLN